MHAEIPGAEHDIRFATAVKNLFFQLPRVLARTRWYFKGTDRGALLHIPRA
jgi:hypothetical protein